MNHTAGRRPPLGGWGSVLWSYLDCASYITAHSLPVGAPGAAPKSLQPQHAEQGQEAPDSPSSPSAPADRKFQSLDPTASCVGPARPPKRPRHRHAKTSGPDLRSLISATMPSPARLLATVLLLGSAWAARDRRDCGFARLVGARGPEGGGVARWAVRTSIRPLDFDPPPPGRPAGRCSRTPSRATPQV